jgi:serine/threonine protein kinase
VCHRDLKLENFVFDDDVPIETGNEVLKLIDFGLSRRYSALNRMSTVVGTPYYIAPEIIKHEQYGLECDIWSLGIILFMLLTGIPPVSGDSDQELLANVARGRLSLENQWTPDWTTVRACVRASVRPCVRACVRASTCAFVHARAWRVLLCCSLSLLFLLLFPFFVGGRVKRPVPWWGLARRGAVCGGSSSLCSWPSSSLPPPPPPSVPSSHPGRGWLQTVAIPPLLRADSHRNQMPDVFDLIKAMLTIDPAKRITAAGIKNHPWMALSNDHAVRDECCCPVPSQSSWFQEYL